MDCIAVRYHSPLAILYSHGTPVVDKVVAANNSWSAVYSVDTGAWWLQLFATFLVHLAVVTGKYGKVLQHFVPVVRLAPCSLLFSDEGTRFQRICFISFPFAFYCGWLSWKNGKGYREPLVIPSPSVLGTSQLSAFPKGNRTSFSWWLWLLYSSRWSRHSTVCSSVLSVWVLQTSTDQSLSENQVNELVLIVFWAIVNYLQ